MQLHLGWLGSVAPAGALHAWSLHAWSLQHHWLYLAPSHMPHHAAPAAAVLQEAEKYDLPVDDVDVVAFSVGNGVILDASLKGAPAAAVFGVCGNGGGWGERGQAGERALSVACTHSCCRWLQ